VLTADISFRWRAGADELIRCLRFPTHLTTTNADETAVVV
jgi:hypothetical protein